MKDKPPLKNIKDSFSGLISLSSLTSLSNLNNNDSIFNNGLNKNPECNFSDVSFDDFKSKSDDELFLNKEFENDQIVESAITINDFEFIKLLNKGAFGRVWLVKRKLTDDLYAMKIVNVIDHVFNLDFFHFNFSYFLL